MAQVDLTDFEWLVIQPLLRTKVRGVKRVDDRRVSRCIERCRVSPGNMVRAREIKVERRRAIGHRVRGLSRSNTVVGNQVAGG